MGDSGLSTALAGVAMLVIVVALLLAAVAWRVRRRPVRIAIGAGLLLLGLFGAAISIDWT